MNSTIPETVELLLAQGYVPIPVKGKVWLESYRGVQLRHVDFAPEPDVTRAAFRANPDHGISVSVPYVRNADRKLIGIDVDVHEPDFAAEVMRRIAAIIGEPVPLKTGMKGGTFFCAYTEHVELRKLYMDQTGNPKPLWLRDYKVLKPGPAGQGKPEGIDLLGPHPAHTVLPPSLHKDTGKPYRWLPFPGTKTVLQLQDIPITKLPVLEPWQFLLISIVMQPGTEAIWQFIGATSPGDFNDRMRDGTLSLYHEGFHTDLITKIAEREARRDPPDDETLSARLAAIRGTVINLPKKFPKKNPAATRKPRGTKIPADRLQADWLLEDLKLDDCAVFNSMPYQWNGVHWQAMIQADHPQPFAHWYAKVRSNFADASHGSIMNAIKMVIATLPIRQPNTSATLIPFNNGVLDVTTMTLRPEERDDNFVGVIQHPFDPQATCPTWENFINDLCLPPEDLVLEGIDDHTTAVNLLEEFLGYGLTRSYKMRHFLMLIGRTSTGKSVLTKVIRDLLPREWTSEVSLENFSEPNSRRRMVNSLINISSETGRARHGKSVDEQILRITSSEPVEVKTLYQDSQEVRLPARLIVNGNLMPDFHDSTGAIERRSLLIRTTNIIPPVEIIGYESVILEEARGILKRLVNAYGRTLARKPVHFQQPVYAKKLLIEATQTANSVAAWVNLGCQQIGDKEPKNTWGVNGELYSDYVEWCDQNGMAKFSSIQWGKLLSAMGIKVQTVRFGANFAQARPLKTNNSTRGF